MPAPDLASCSRRLKSTGMKCERGFFTRVCPGLGISGSASLQALEFLVSCYDLVFAPFHGVVFISGLENNGMWECSLDAQNGPRYSRKEACFHWSELSQEGKLKATRPHTGPLDLISAFI